VVEEVFHLVVVVLLVLLVVQEVVFYLVVEVFQNLKEEEVA